MTRLQLLLGAYVGVLLASTTWLLFYRAPEIRRRRPVVSAILLVLSVLSTMLGVLLGLLWAASADRSPVLVFAAITIVPSAVAMFVERMRARKMAGTGAQESSGGSSEQL